MSGFKDRIHPHCRHRKTPPVPSSVCIASVPVLLPPPSASSCFIRSATIACVHARRSSSRACLRTWALGNAMAREVSVDCAGAICRQLKVYPQKTFGSRRVARAQCTQRTQGQTSFFAIATMFSLTAASKSGSGPAAWKSMCTLGHAISHWCMCVRLELALTKENLKLVVGTTQMRNLVLYLTDQV